IKQTRGIVDTMRHSTPIPLHRPPPPPDAIQSPMSRAFIHGHRLRQAQTCASTTDDRAAGATSLTVM
ncbi:MAG: hypothetical protein ACPIOQ_69610, partial [Promethearchaeia archaeon]